MRSIRKRNNSTKLHNRDTKQKKKKPVKNEDMKLECKKCGSKNVYSTVKELVCRKCGNRTKKKGKK